MARQQGRSTQQMIEAPEYAVFVWCDGDLKHPRQLARKLQRYDLEIVQPSWLTNRRWIGLKLTAIVVDHELLLTEDQHASLCAARERIRNYSSEKDCA